MSCGKKPLRRLWDKPRVIINIKASRYQKNEASVKVHWRKVIKGLEDSYQDECFWESQGEVVRHLVGPLIYERLAKLYNLPLREKPYVVPSIPSVVAESEEFYLLPDQEDLAIATTKMSIEMDLDMVEVMEEQTEWDRSWTDTSTSTKSGQAIGIPRGSRRSFTKSKSDALLSQIKSMTLSKGTFKTFSKVLSRLMSRTFNKSRSMSKFTNESWTSDESPSEHDDVIVHAKSKRKLKSIRSGRGTKHKNRSNPHYQMLYCSDSVTDMIKWPSRMYERRTFDLEASDEYSKKAELLTKQVALSFYEWWVSVGSAEYKSEIKRPRDIEELFQVWFDEHASRGLVLDPKILPCVLQTIANYVGIPKASCPSALKRQIAWDIWAETSPAHTRAFNTSLPHNLKHIPPRNNTAENWHPVRIPEDLKSMDCVWKDITYLTSTKSFQSWLAKHPAMPMPPCLKDLSLPDGKKALFAIPSDFVFGASQSEKELSIPVSKVNLEIKEILSKLMND